MKLENLAGVCLVIASAFVGFKGGNIKNEIEFNKEIKFALSQIQTTPEFQEKFLGNGQPGFDTIYRLAKKNKPEIPEARGITNNQGALLYLAIEDGSYYFLAPMPEFMGWVKAEKKRIWKA